MKKIVASVGLVALGASSLQATPPSFLSDPSKPWSISATLRGFYDDNINSVGDDVVLPSGSKRESWGYEVSPAAMLHWSLDQTTISLGYVYSFKYYENKPYANDSHDDQTHTFNLGFDHTFSPRFNLNVNDSFVIGQEPDILRAGNSFATFQRVPGDNLRNYGTLTLNGQLTPLFGLEVGYGNGWYRYDDRGYPGSLGSILNRVEQTPHIDTRWQILPTTTAIFGYQYRDVDYYENDIIGSNADGYLYSDARNTRSHAVYGGVDHNFRSDLTGSLRAGARFTDYYNDPYTDNSTNPFIQASLRWAYLPDSFVEVGYTYDMTATDVVGISNTGITTDAETQIVYGTVKHRILPNLYGGLTAQFQDSSLHGGSTDGMDELFYLVGLNLEYRFNKYFAAHAGYNYDKLDSDIGRSFDRNRVYVGVTASY